jgi:putative ABC transport system permease protein
VIISFRIMATAREELLANKGRSIITAACIAVAIAAFAVIMQLGSSAERGVDDAVERTQGRAGTVRMTTSGAPLAALLRAAEVSGADKTRTRLTTAWGRSLKISGVPFTVAGAGSRATTLNLNAVDPGITGVLPANISYGRWFTNSDSASLALPVVIGPSASREIVQDTGIEPAKLIGRTLVNDKPTAVRMRIVGIAKDGPLIRFLDNGNVAFVPISTSGINQALMPYQQGSDSVDLYALSRTAGDDSGSQLKAAAQRTLSGEGQYAAEITTERVDRADDFADAGRALATLLAAIGVIALLVGVIGVTNVNLMAVRERTREFGLRRALGSSPSVVSGLVMAETVMVIMAGGAVGVTIAAVLSWVASSYLPGLIDGVPINPVTFSTAAIGLGASAISGLLAGFIPAWRARRITIIQAIRR